jgi:hypothetical protein
VHAIELDEERVEIILDDAGEPIGPTNEVVAKFSSFIGTIARSPTYCPLIYTTFKAFTDDEKEAMWKFVNVWENKFYISLIFQIPFIHW